MQRQLAALHRDCHLFKWPSANEEFWRAKIGTMQRHVLVKQRLTEAGWHVWECTVRKALRERFAEVAVEVKRWLKSLQKCDYDTPGVSQ